jgi:hypothetical protein
MNFRSIDKEGTTTGFSFSFFFQFCDIENLTDFSQNKMFNFYFEFFGGKSPIILSKKGKFCPKKSLNIMKAD